VRVSGYGGQSAALGSREYSNEVTDRDFTCQLIQTSQQLVCFMCSLMGREWSYFLYAPLHASVTEEHHNSASCFLWVFENRVLRIIFGPKRDEVTGEWRKLHNEELHNLYSYH
jgi:hypothetical protein